MLPEGKRVVTYFSDSRAGREAYISSENSHVSFPPKSLRRVAPPPVRSPARRYTTEDRAGFGNTGWVAPKKRGGSVEASQGHTARSWRKTLARAASDRATSGGRRMFHLGNERSKTGQGFKSFVHSNMLPQPYAASSLFAATNNFTVGRSWPCRLFFARGRKLTIISRHRQIDARAPFCPGAIVKRDIALPRASQRKQKNRGGHARAAGGDHRAFNIHPSLRHEGLDFVVRFNLAGLDHLAPRQVETAGNMARAQSGTRLGFHASESRGRSGIEDLGRTGFACPLHRFGTGNGGAVEIHGVGPRHAPHKSLFDRAPLGAPSWQTAGKDFYVRRAEDSQGPTHAGSSLQVGGVVDDEAHAIAKAELFHCLGKAGRVGQHVRQIRRMIRDRIDVEEDGAGDMPFEIFRLGVAFFSGQEKRAVDDRDIGRTQMFRKPCGRDEESVLRDCCHARASHFTWRFSAGALRVPRFRKYKLNHFRFPYS